ncbi:MAG TPA: hypothetical protein VID93_03700 [Acidimicrobiales bacterium]
MLLAALDAERVATLGLLLVVGLIVVAAVVAVLARAIVVKVLAVAALFGIGAVVWSQRASLEDCTQEVKDGLVGAGPATECTFLGLKVDVNVP